MKYKERYSKIAQLGCIVCGLPAQIHHLVGSRYRGMGQKADNQYTIPLCLNHHTGAEGIHQIGKRTWEAQYGTQEELLQRTNEIIETSFT